MSRKFYIFETIFSLFMVAWMSWGVLDTSTAPLFVRLIFVVCTAYWCWNFIRSAQKIWSVNQKENTPFVVLDDGVIANGHNTDEEIVVNVSCMISFLPIFEKYFTDEQLQKWWKLRCPTHKELMVEKIKPHIDKYPRCKSFFTEK